MEEVLVLESGEQPLWFVCEGESDCIYMHMLVSAIGIQAIWYIEVNVICHEVDGQDWREVGAECFRLVDLNWIKHRSFPCYITKLHH